ncbi:Hypp3276 [Branchiostoma lanceolatum]|uniref:Hypp3276 protein n=1 Tax=Branchiostoma lanceolatum TaxID=7740 RepID=A0A8K0ETQ3_BRALA|nr:Hypp3276 [Branchiostoma lanceolatum]
MMYGTTDLCDASQEDMFGGRRLKPSTSAPLRKRRVSMPAYLPVYKPAVASKEDKLQSIREGAEFYPEEQQEDPSLPRFRRFSVIVPPSANRSRAEPSKSSRRSSVSESSRLLRGSAKNTERASALQPILFVVVLVVAVVLVSTACSRLFRRLN